MYQIVVQARRKSHRFPDKVFADLCGKSMIVQILKRLGVLDIPIVVAIPWKSGSFILYEHIIKHGFRCDVSAIPEDDVLSRFIDVLARLPRPKGIIRITADCPLIDPALIREGIDIYERGDANYIAIGPNYPDGLDFEIMDYQLLIDADKHARNLVDREHVTPFIWRGDTTPPARQHLLHCPRDLKGHKWSVDNPDDLEFVRNVYREISGDTRWQAVADLLERPDMMHLKAHATRTVQNQTYLKQIGTHEDWLTVRYGEYP